MLKLQSLNYDHIMANWIDYFCSKMKLHFYMNVYRLVKTRVINIYNIKMSSAVSHILRRKI